MSRLSAITKVAPHAVRPLNPRLTIGMPGAVTPADSKPGHFWCIIIHTFGIMSARRVALQMMDFPLLVFLPDTAQLFEAGMLMDMVSLSCFRTSFQLPANRLSS